MHIQIPNATPALLVEYAQVPIAFVVREVFTSEAIDKLRHGEHATPTPVPVPYRKDYDAYAGHHPTDWPRRFDLSGWIILAATEGHKRIGAAALAVNDPELDLRGDLSGRALIWDLRVAPEARRRGVGRALLRAAQRASLERGARELCVETQQINVPACRFYLREGFALESVRFDAYPDLPEEAQLLWAKSLVS
jgi:ribosomal protein S18 acetylase RimI-like enzyme